MQIFAMKYERELSLAEVTEIAGNVMREFIAAETKDMNEDEIGDFINETLEDYDEDADVETDEMFEAVLDEVNNFPAVATAEDFVKSIRIISDMSGIDNAGLWWEVIEECLALRIGRKNNCLA